MQRVVVVEKYVTSVQKDRVIIEYTKSVSGRKRLKC